MIYSTLKAIGKFCPNHWRLFFRTAYHSRSLRTARVLHTERRFDTTVKLPGFPGMFGLRTGTSDAEFVRMLANGYDFPEYRIPVPVKPKVILDFGANIGASAILFARRYPQAQIFAFEPRPDNVQFLERNVAAYENITVVPYGVGRRTEELDYYFSCLPSSNTGGFYNDGSLSWATQGPHAEVMKLPVLAVDAAFERYGITRADIIKIDCEGAEFDILESIPTDTLETVKVIVGEFHGTRNDDIKAFLEDRFDVNWQQTHDRSAEPDGGGIGVFQAVRNTPSAGVEANQRRELAGV